MNREELSQHHGHRAVFETHPQIWPRPWGSEWLVDGASLSQLWARPHAHCPLLWPADGRHSGTCSSLLALQVSAATLRNSRFSGFFRVWESENGQGLLHQISYIAEDTFSGELET